MGRFVTLDDGRRGLVVEWIVGLEPPYRGELRVVYQDGPHGEEAWVPVERVTEIEMPPEVDDDDEFD